MAEFNKSFFERGCDVIPLINQGDANSDVTGDWVKLRDYTRVLVYMAKFGSEDVDDMALEFLQATDASGTSSKALNVSRYWTKTGTLTSATVWTAGTLTTPIDKLAFGSSVPTGATRVIADVNTSPLLLAVDIQSADLDVDGGFDWMTCFLGGANVDNSLLITVTAILQGGRYPQLTPLSAIS